jgi:hypothetical protein
MGTRNLTIVMADGEPRIAQYCQWDGYPSGQGKTVLEFCRKHLTSKRGKDLAAFRLKLANVKPVDDEGIKALWADVGVDLVKSQGLVNMADSATFKGKWPTLDRDHGALILETVFNSTGMVPVRDPKGEIGFVKDSLFCEWAYLIDLDHGTLEVYKGFNQKPLGAKQRFAHLNEQCESRGSGNTYYPVKCIKKYRLNALPTVAEFLKLEGSED